MTNVPHYIKENLDKMNVWSSVELVKAAKDELGEEPGRVQVQSL